jgi:vancomycin resistance protein YoaR
MDNRDTAPTRRRAPEAPASGKSAPQTKTTPDGKARIKPAPSGSSVRRTGEYSSRISARDGSGSAPVVRNRPASGTNSTDYQSRVRSSAGSASGNASVNVRPAGARTGASQGASRSGAARPAQRTSGSARPNGQRPAKPAPNGAARRAPHSQGAGVRHKKQKDPAWVTALMCVCLIALVGVGYVGVTEVSNYIDYRNKCRELEQDRFYEGITLEGEPLSGMTLLEAVAKYQQQISNVASSTSITINARGKTYTMDSKSVQMSTDLQSTLSQAYSVGRSGSFDERYAKLQQLKTEGMNFSLNRGWNEDTLRTKIAEIAKDVYVKGQDADVDTFDPDSGEFTFISEVTGYELDTDDLYNQITQAIANGQVSVNIDAKVNEVAPEHTVAYMKEHFGRISYMRTETSSNSDRNKNIRLAADCFNGMRVDPGETVSFNETTGERTYEKGYRDAPAYSGGVVVKEPGGGVCQVSTTLYNAVAKADLEIIDRSPHTRVSDYVPIGLDAAVNWPNQDFVFKNNTDYPIFISAEYYDRNLTVKIYGHQMADGVYIMLESEKTATIPAPSGIEEKKESSLPSGTRQKGANARDGYKAVSYKVYYDADNNEIKREKLDNSYYREKKEIWLIGTG